MAQSYGNPSTSALTAAVDEILGVTKVTQDIGTSLSEESPTTASVTGTLTIKPDNATVATTVTITGLISPQDIAEAIETQMQAAPPSAPAGAGAYTGFTCRYDAVLDKYVLRSGTSPATTSRVEVTGGTAAAALHLGAANNGTESYTGAEVITYTVKYRFVFGAGASYGGADIVVESADMTTPTSLVELTAIANERAAQVKAEQLSPDSPLSSTGISSVNGPVTLDFGL